MHRTVSDLAGPVIHLVKALTTAHAFRTLYSYPLPFPVLETGCASAQCWCYLCSD